MKNQLESGGTRRKSFLKKIKFALEKVKPSTTKILNPFYSNKPFDRENQEKIFKEILEENHTYIYQQEKKSFEDWVLLWKMIIIEHELSTIVYSSKSSFAIPLNEAITRAMEVNKKINFFHSDDKSDYLNNKQGKINFSNYQTGITDVEAGLTDTGSLLIIPHVDEPRSLSLVPPIHIAVLNREKLFPSFNDWVDEVGKDLSHFSNLVMVSGPSKTADIEKRLVYGVHGPKKVIVVLH